MQLLHDRAQSCLYRLSARVCKDTHVVSMYSQRFWGPFLWDWVHETARYADLNDGASWFAQWCELFQQLIPCFNCAGHFKLEIKNVPSTNLFAWTVDMHDRITTRIQQSLALKQKATIPKALHSEASEWLKKYTGSWAAVEKSTFEALKMLSFINSLAPTEKFAAMYKLIRTRIAPSSVQLQLESYETVNPIPPTCRVGERSDNARRLFTWTVAVHRSLCPDAPDQASLVKLYEEREKTIRASLPKATEAELIQIRQMQDRIRKAVDQHRFAHKMPRLDIPNTKIDKSADTIKSIVNNRSTVPQTSVPTNSLDSNHPTVLHDFTQDELDSWTLALVLTVIAVVLTILLLYLIRSQTHKDLNLSRLTPRIATAIVPETTINTMTQTVQ